MLQSFLHVSTAYCNCNVKHIEEKVYEPPLAPHKLLDACEYVYISCSAFLYMI